MGVSRIIFIQEALQKNFFFLLAFSIYWRHFPHSSVGKESACNAGNPDSTWVGKICWRRDRPPTPVFLGSPCGSAGKESACNVGDLGWITGLGRSLGEGKGYSLQYSGLKYSMDYTHRIAKTWSWLSKIHFTSCTNTYLVSALEEIINQHTAKEKCVHKQWNYHVWRDINIMHIKSSEN